MKKVILLIVAALVFGIFGGFSVKDIGYEHIDVEDGTLYGKIQYAGKETVVIIIAGSGPTDMDGNTALSPGRNDSIAQIAKALKQKGISTLRYDKRTAGKSAQAFNTKEMDFDLFVSDCEAVIRYVKVKGYEKIYLAGHSQGSLIAMLAAVNEQVDGIISIAGAGFPIDVTLERQLIPKIGEDSREIEILKGLRKGKVDDTASTDDPLMSPKNQRFLLSWMRYDPADAVREPKCPVLIVQGTSDLQVDRSEFKALTDARPDSKTLMIDGMNHVLKPVKDQQENIAAYTDPSFNIDERLIEAISVFINQ